MSDRPLAPFGRRRVRVTASRRVGGYAIVTVADPDGPRPAPGQFSMLATVDGWGAGEDGRPYLPRAISQLHAGPGEVTFLLADVGPGTHELHAARTDDELWLAGPFGRPFAPPSGSRRPLHVAGGVGIAPVGALQDEVGGEALLGFRDAGLAQASVLLEDVAVATDDGSAGHHGLVTDLLVQRLDEHGPDAFCVYACGPPAMLEAVRAVCVEREVEAQLALEAGMACGFGACFGCVVATNDGFARVCVDGPVFAAEALADAWTAGVGH